MKRLAFGIVALMFVASWSSFGLAKEEGVLDRVKGAASEAKEEMTGEKGTAEKAGELGFLVIAAMEESENKA